jgi:DNA repair exonuclease SbcCD ATPase subunit
MTRIVHRPYDVIKIGLTSEEWRLISMVLSEGAADRDRRAASMKDREWPATSNPVEAFTKDAAKCRVLKDAIIASLDTTESETAQERRPELFANDGAAAPVKPAKVRKPKKLSRGQRWASAVSDAQNALGEIKGAVEEHRGALEAALEELKSIQEEYSDWESNLPENLQSSTLADKLSTVTGLDLEPDLDDLDEVESLLSEAEGLDLPLGFGRD